MHDHVYIRYALHVLRWHLNVMSSTYVIVCLALCERGAAPESNCSLGTEAGQYLGSKSAHVRQQERLMFEY